jgi:hypothetical protein
MTDFYLFAFSKKIPGIFPEFMEDPKHVFVFGLESIVCSHAFCADSDTIAHLRNISLIDPKVKDAWKFINEMVRYGPNVTGEKTRNFFNIINHNFERLKEGLRKIKTSRNIVRGNVRTAVHQPAGAEQPTVAHRPVSVDEPTAAQHPALMTCFACHGPVPRQPDTQPAEMRFCMRCKIYFFTPDRKLVKVPFVPRSEWPMSAIRDKPMPIDEIDESSFSLSLLSNYIFKSSPDEFFRAASLMISILEWTNYGGPAAITDPGVTNDQ